MLRPAGRGAGGTGGDSAGGRGHFGGRHPHRRCGHRLSGQHRGGAPHRAHLLGRPRRSELGRQPGLPRLALASRGAYQSAGARVPALPVRGLELPLRRTRQVERARIGTGESARRPGATLCGARLPRPRRRCLSGARNGPPSSTGTRGKSRPGLRSSAGSDNPGAHAKRAVWPESCRSRRGWSK